MAVSGVDSGRSEEVNRTREEYSSNETKSAKKRKKQLENLQKTHAKEVQDIQSNYEKALDEERKAARTSLSERDKKYQKEMDDIKKMHIQKLQDVSEKTTEELDAVKLHEKVTTEQEKKINETQKDNLKGHLETQIKEKDAQYDRLVGSSREKQAQALKEQRQSLGQAHQKQQKSLTDNREEEVGALQKDNRDLRRQKDFSEKQAKIQSTIQKADQEERLQQDLQNDRRAQSAEYDRMKGAFDRNVQTLKDKYTQADQDREKRFQDNILSLDGSAQSRSREQIGALKRKLQTDKLAANTRNLETQRLDTLERQNVTKAAEDRIASMSGERDQMIDESRRLSKDEVEHMSKQNEKGVKYLEGFYQGKLDYSKNVEQEALIEKNKDLQTERRLSDDRHTKVQAKGLENYQREQQTQQEFHMDQIDQLNHVHENEKREIHVQGVKEKNEAVSRLLERMRENQAIADEKMNFLKDKYETQIAEMKDSFAKETRRQQNFNETRKKEQEKDFQMKFESEKGSNEGRLAAERERHNEEIDQLKKRFEMEKIEFSKRKA